MVGVEAMALLQVSVLVQVDRWPKMKKGYLQLEWEVQWCLGFG